jgi:peroxiredoxin family protein
MADHAVSQAQEPRPAPADHAGVGPLRVLLLSGTFERAHYALAVAGAAAALDRPVILFVTLAGLHALLPEDAAGRAGWARLPLAAGLAEPGVADGETLDARYRARGIGGFEELLESCAALGVEIMVCEMGLRALGLEAAQLRPDLPLRMGGLATLLAQGGQMIAL